MTRAALLVLSFGVALPLCAQQDPWFEWNKSAAAAYRQKDYTSLRARLEKMAAAAPGQPEVLYKLAVADALGGHPEDALAALRRYAAMGLVRDFQADPDLATLRARPELASILRRIDENRRPVSRSQAAFTLPAGLLTEDIVHDQMSGAFFVSSIHQRKILRISRDGAVTDFVAGGDRVWGIMALAVDPVKRVLWATTSALPQSGDYRVTDKDRSAVLVYDLGTGKLVKRYDPPAGERHSFGDMTLDSEGNAIVSDSYGPVYTIRRRRDALEVLVPAGVFMSPQTPAACPDGRIFVADYGRGIGIIDPATHAVSWLQTPPDLAVSGIDGLYLTGESLIVIQNGTDPQRLLRFRLDPSLTRAAAWEVLERNASWLSEPTHGAFAGKDFYFVAHSGWDEWTDEGALKPGVTPKPSVVRRFPVLR